MDYYDIDEVQSGRKVSKKCNGTHLLCHAITYIVLPI